jgi:uncharacterized membrane protein (Fun14 family)
MSSEVLLSSIIPFAGSGLVGYAIGFALKKILKWILIIVGFLAGMFFMGVQLLQKYGYVSTVNWDKHGKLAENYKLRKKDLIILFLIVIGIIFAFIFCLVEANINLINSP